MKLLLVPLLSLLLAACAASPRGAGTTADAEGTICERESRTGSMLSSSRCRTEAQREAERRAAAAVGENMRQSAPTPVGGGKGP
ncbi:hypothetical protein ACG02S_17325 [Roseateles sp. DC23W]|uniref:Secreted protein n=1 Tax=Pelomonas dachongensis TaxID=3299029 RepID=A0ABW7EQE0_9BURK